MKISNPLTIIAVFAGLAEALATVALVNLPLEIQSIFIYFVMFFPASIIFLFFYILYHKNTVLYAPSDFSDQGHYLEINNLEKDLDAATNKAVDQINKNKEKLSESDVEILKYYFSESIDKNFNPEIYRSESKSEADIKFIDDQKKIISEIISFLSSSDVIRATVGEICQGIGENKSRTKNMLRKLENKNIVQRSINEDDNIVLWEIKII